MRQFNFEPEDEGFDGFDDMEGMEGQFWMPVGMGADSTAELQKELLVTTRKILENSWFWPWYSPQYKIGLFLTTYLSLETLLIEEKKVE